MIFCGLVVRDSPLVSTAEISMDDSVLFQIFRITCVELINVGMSVWIGPVAVVRKHDCTVSGGILPVNQIFRAGHRGAVVEFSDDRMDKQVDIGKIVTLFLRNPVKGRPPGIFLFGGINLKPPVFSRR